MKYFVFRIPSSISRYLDIAIAVMSMTRSAVVCSIAAWRPGLFPPRPPIAFLSPKPRRSHLFPPDSLPPSPKASPPPKTPPRRPLGGDRRKKPRVSVRAANKQNPNSPTHSLARSLARSPPPRTVRPD